MTEPRPADAGMEGARLFAARLEVLGDPERRLAELDDLAPVLALFARARARLESQDKMSNDISRAAENMGAHIGGYPT